MFNRIVPLLVAVMSLALSGCFVSDQPKFTLGTAAPAFGDGGRYEVLERVEGDTYRHQEVFGVKHNGDGSYDLSNEKGEVQPVSFYALADGLFVGQARTGKETSKFGYVVLRVTGNEAFIYLPQCDEQDKAKLDAFKVVPEGKYTCSIDTVSDPLGLFAALDLGKPVSKMVRQ